MFYAVSNVNSYVVMAKFDIAWSVLKNLSIYHEVVLFSFYYSHIFPDCRAQHCSYATLLAGRCGNNLWYSVIFPMGPSLLSTLVFAVRVIGFLCPRCIYFSGLYLATCSVLCLSFSLPRCACLYLLEVFRNGASMCLRSPCFPSISLWGVYCVKESLAAPYVHSTACPSYANALSSKWRLNRRGISSVYYTYRVSLYPILNFVQVRVCYMVSQ